MGHDLAAQETVLRSEVAFDVGETRDPVGVGQRQCGQATHRVADQVTPADCSLGQRLLCDRDQEGHRNGIEVRARGGPAAGCVVGQYGVIGCTLLHRTQRSVALSPAGAVFLGECRALLRHAEDAEAVVRHAATGSGGRLRLGAVASAFSWPLPVVLQRFHDVVPDVEVLAWEIDAHEAAPGLLDRSLDWAIVRQTAPVRGTTSTRLYADRFVAALPAGHPCAATGEPLTLATLARETWVWLHRHISPDYHDAMATLCRTAGFSPMPAHWARSVTSQITMVECGLGITIAPAAAAASHPPPDEAGLHAM